MKSQQKIHALFGALICFVQLSTHATDMQKEAYISGVTVKSVSSEHQGRCAEDTLNEREFLESDKTITNSIIGWMTDRGDYAPQVTYDLGALYDLDGIQIWNWNQGPEDAGFTVSGVKNITISVAKEDEVFTDIEEPVCVDQASGASGYEGQRIMFKKNGVRYVRISPTSTHQAAEFFDRGDDQNWYNDAGIAKVRFVGTPSTGK